MWEAIESIIYTWKERTGDQDSDSQVIQFGTPSSYRLGMCHYSMILKMSGYDIGECTLALMPRHITAPPKKHAKTSISAFEDVGYRNK